MDGTLSWSDYANQRLNKDSANSGKSESTDARSNPQDRSAESEADAWLRTHLGEDAKFQAGPVVGNKFKLPEFTLARKGQGQVQDSFNRIKQVQEAVVKQGGTITLASDMYRAEERYHNRKSARIDEFFDKEAAPMMRDMAKQKLDPDLVASLAYAEHAPERNKEMKQKNPDVATGSGMSDKQAEDIIKAVNALPNAKDYYAMTQRLRDITRGTLSMLERGGLVDTKTANTYRSQYKNYVPLKGWEAVDDDTGRPTGTGQGMSVSRGIIEAKGRDSRAGNIIEQIIQDRQRAIVAEEKNNVGKHTLNFIRTNPDKGLWSEQGSRGQAVSSDKVIAPDDISSPWVILRDPPPLKDSQLAVFENGKRRIVEFTDTHMAVQFKSLDRVNAIPYLRGVMHYLSTVRTAKNPLFLVRNASRDATTGLINLTGEVGLHEAIATQKYYPGAMNAVRAHSVGSKVSPEWSKWLDLYRKNGGQMAIGWVDEIKSIENKLMGEFDWQKGAASLASEGEVWRATKVVGNKTASLLTRQMEAMNTGLENAMRLAAFRRAVEKGMSESDAASLALNLTVNFSKKGSATPLIGSLYLFFNPRVQGAKRTFDALANSKHKGQARAMAGGLMFAGFMLAQMARGAFGGDDEDKEKYLNIPDYERAGNFIFMRDKIRYMIPVSLDFAPFYNAGRVMSDVMNGASATDASGKILQAFVDMLLPVTLTDRDGGATTESVVTGLLPTLAQLPVNLAFNRNSFGGKLMPDSDRSMPENLRMSKSTRGTVWDDLAQNIDKTTKHEVQISPESIKETWNFFTGGLGTLTQQTADYGIARWNDVDVDQNRTPFVSIFRKEESPKDIASAYYDAANKTTKIAGAAKYANKNKDKEYVSALEKDHKKEIELGNAAAEIQKADSKAASALAAIRTSDKSPQERDRLSRAIELDMAKRRRAYLHDYRRMSGDIQ